MMSAYWFKLNNVGIVAIVIYSLSTISISFVLNTVGPNLDTSIAACSLDILHLLLEPASKKYPFDPGIGNRLVPFTPERNSTSTISCLVDAFNFESIFLSLTVDVGRSATTVYLRAFQPHFFVGIVNLFFLCIVSINSFLFNRLVSLRIPVSYLYANNGSGILIPIYPADDRRIT